MTAFFDDQQNAKSALSEMLPMVFGYRSTALLTVAAKLGLADHLKDGPKSASEVATLCEAHAPTLHRIARALVNRGVLDEMEDGRFALNARGNLLRSDVPNSLREMVIYFGDLSYRAYSALLYSARTGEAAFDKVFGMGFYEYLAQDPELNKAYNHTLTAGGTAPNMLLSYDYSRARLIVDVGGGDGAMMCGILALHSQSTGIVFDAPADAAQARARIEAAALSDRCEFVPGNFFDCVPANGDVYLLARVLANWNDDRAGKILDNVRGAGRERSTLLVLEQVMPASMEHREMAVEGDINVLAHLGGRIRTETEFQELLAAHGFSVIAFTPVGSRRRFCMIECARQG